MSIWTDANLKELVFIGYTGLPTEYIHKLALECRAYGFTTYELAGQYVICETIDLVVMTDLFKRVVPFSLIKTGQFKAVMGNKAELANIELQIYKQEQDNALKLSGKQHPNIDDPTVRKQEERPERVLC